MIQEPRIARRPRQQPRELLRRARKRRRQVPVHRGLAPVVPDLPYRHREPRRDSHTSDARQE